MMLTFKIDLSPDTSLVLYREDRGVIIELWKDNVLTSTSVQKPNEFRRMAELLS